MDLHQAVVTAAAGVALYFLSALMLLWSAFARRGWVSAVLIMWAVLLYIFATLFVMTAATTGRH